MQEVERLKELGVEKVFLEDDSLLAKKARVIEIMRRLRGLGLTLADVNGVNLVHLYRGGVPDRNYMGLLGDAGLAQIVFPVESGSQRILDKYATGKVNLERMDVISLVAAARFEGLVTPVNMMIGFPDETEAEMNSSIELARRLVDAGAPYVAFFIPIPFPGSELYRQAIAGGHLSSDFDPDTMNYKNGVMERTVVPRERIVELRDWAFDSVNPAEHVRLRLEQSTGARWKPK